MIRFSSPSSARAERHTRRTRRIVAGILASASLLMPLGASGMDSSLRLTADTAGSLLPLPSIPCLGSMRWMSWKPLPPLFKTDTLILPDSARPGLFRFPSEFERSLPRVS